MDSESSEPFDHVGYEAHAAKMRELIDRHKAARARGDDKEAWALHMEAVDMLNNDGWTEKLLEYSKQLLAEARRRWMANDN